MVFPPRFAIRWSLQLLWTVSLQMQGCGHEFIPVSCCIPWHPHLSTPVTPEWAKSLTALRPGLHRIPVFPAVGEIRSSLGIRQLL
jgi:hypothetical protein